jgi:serine/threonine protein kinase
VEIDWWALGIVCFEFLTGWPPFFDKDFNAMCEKILTRPLKFPSKCNISINAQSVIRALLQRDMRDRLCCSRPVSNERAIDSLQNHSFFGDFDFNQVEAGIILPPFIPSVGRDPTDTRNFDREFTKLTLKESPPDPKKMVISVSLLSIFFCSIFKNY